jgi:hypothetical protein
MAWPVSCAWAASLVAQRFHGHLVLLLTLPTMPLGQVLGLRLGSSSRAGSLDAVRPHKLEHQRRTCSTPEVTCRVIGHGLYIAHRCAQALPGMNVEPKHKFMHELCASFARALLMGVRTTQFAACQPQHLRACAGPDSSAAKLGPGRATQSSSSDLQRLLPGERAAILRLLVCGRCQDPGANDCF